MIRRSLVCEIVWYLIKPFEQKMPPVVNISSRKNNLALLFHSHHPLCYHVRRTPSIYQCLRPPSANSNDHHRQVDSADFAIITFSFYLSPLTHPISLALSPAITGQLARALLYTYLPRRRASLGFLSVMVLFLESPPILCVTHLRSKQPPS